MDVTQHTNIIHGTLSLPPLNVALLKLVNPTGPPHMRQNLPMENNPSNTCECHISHKVSNMLLDVRCEKGKKQQQLQQSDKI